MDPKLLLKILKRGFVDPDLDQILIEDYTKSIKKKEILKDTKYTDCKICFKINGKLIECCGVEGSSNTICLKCLFKINKCPFCRKII